LSLIPKPHLNLFEYTLGLSPLPQKRFSDAKKIPFDKVTKYFFFIAAFFNFFLQKEHFSCCKKKILGQEKHIGARIKLFVTFSREIFL